MSKTLTATPSSIIWRNKHSRITVEDAPLESAPEIIQRRIALTSEGVTVISVRVHPNFTPRYVAIATENIIVALKECAEVLEL